MKTVAESIKEDIEFKRTGNIKNPCNKTSKIKQFFCKHHFDLNQIKRDNIKEVSYLYCTKCQKRFENYYGYQLIKYAKTITPIHHKN